MAGNNSVFRLGLKVINWRCQFIAARRGTVAHFADLAMRSITGCAARHSNASRYKVFTNFQNDLIQGTKDIFEKHVKNHQISSNYATFTPNFAPKAAHHQIRHIGETHWLFQKGMTNLVLWKFSQSLENNGTKILKIRASLFLSCTP